MVFATRTAHSLARLRRDKSRTHLILTQGYPTPEHATPEIDDGFRLGSLGFRAIPDGVTFVCQWSQRDAPARLFQGVYRSLGLRV